VGGGGAGGLGTYTGKEERGVISNNSIMYV